MERGHGEDNGNAGKRAARQINACAGAQRVRKTNMIIRSKSRWKTSGTRRSNLREVRHGRHDMSGAGIRRREGHASVGRASRVRVRTRRARRPRKEPVAEEGTGTPTRTSEAGCGSSACNSRRHRRPADRDVPACRGDACAQRAPSGVQQPHDRATMHPASGKQWAQRQVGPRP